MAALSLLSPKSAKNSYHRHMTELNNIETVSDNRCGVQIDQVASTVGHKSESKFQRSVGHFINQSRQYVPIPRLSWKCPIWMTKISKKSLCG